MENNHLSPSNHEAEQAVICCLLNDSRLVPVALDKLTPECFHHFQTEAVFAAISHLHKTFKPVDSVSIISHLRNTEQLEKIGGSSVIMELFTYLPIPGWLDHYAEILTEKHAMRQVVAAAAAIVERTRNPEMTSAGVMEYAVEEFTRLSASRLNSADMLPCRSFADIINDCMDKAEDRAANNGRIPGIPTGFHAIDQHTGGMQEGRLWVIAGETSDGKSTLVQNFMEEACRTGNHGVYYSYEMPDTECAERFICSQGRIDNAELMSGKFTPSGLIGWQRANRDMKSWKLSLLDVADATIEQICRDITLRINSIRKTESAARFVASIDYLQLANTKEKFGDNRERAVAHISKTAKQCAKRNRVTILMPSQLNDDGKMRESRAIGHDADVVLVIRKPKQEDQKGGKKTYGKETPDADLTDMREIFCGKNRGGKRNWKTTVRLNGANFQFVEQ